MTRILYLLLIIGLTYGCKPKPENAFLTGRLINQCNGQPVANTSLHLYQNFQEGVNWLQADKDAEKLATVTTDETGHFFFYGEGYTNKKTTILSNTSIRTDDNRILVTGNLGKGKGEANDITTHQDVGDLVQFGIPIDIHFKIATQNNTTVYDSVRLFSVYYNVDTMLTVVDNDFFTGTIHQQTLWIKNLWQPSDIGYNQYNLYLRLDFYRNNGNTIKEVWHDFFFPQCVNSGDALFTFE